MLPLKITVHAFTLTEYGPGSFALCPEKIKYIHKRNLARKHAGIRFQCYLLRNTAVELTYREYSHVQWSLSYTSISC